jgi:hypothetical protein
MNFQVDNEEGHLWGTIQLCFNQGTYSKVTVHVYTNDGVVKLTIGLECSVLVTAVRVELGAAGDSIIAIKWLLKVGVCRSS